MRTHPSNRGTPQLCSTFASVAVLLVVDAALCLGQGSGVLHRSDARVHGTFKQNVYAIFLVCIFLSRASLYLTKPLLCFSYSCFVCLQSWLLFGVYEIGCSIEDPFQGSLRLSILCDGIRRDVLGEDLHRDTAFRLSEDEDDKEEEEQLHNGGALRSQVKRIVKEPASLVPASRVLSMNAAAVAAMPLVDTREFDKIHMSFGEREQDLVLSQSNVRSGMIDLTGAGFHSHVILRKEEDSEDERRP
jgi:hypothetical protein